MIDRLKAWCRHSLTIAIARALYVLGTALEIAAQAADFLNAIGFAAFVPPNYTGLYTVAIAVIVELARRRSLNKATG
jgi:hypothetical protein